MTTKVLITDTVNIDDALTWTSQKNYFPFGQKTSLLVFLNHRILPKLILTYYKEMELHLTITVGVCHILLNSKIYGNIWVRHKLQVFRAR